MHNSKRKVLSKQFIKYLQTDSVTGLQKYRNTEIQDYRITGTHFKKKYSGLLIYFLIKKSRNFCYLIINFIF